MITSVSYREETKHEEADDGDERPNLRSQPVTQSKRFQTVPLLTEQEMNQALDNFFLEDEHTVKTWSRILVEKFLSKYNWYFPSRKMKHPPSLSKAYAYFEHFALPRKLAGGETAKHILRRADPGESDVNTELYSVLRTPSTSLIEWGIGVDQYFVTLRIMAVVLLIAGLIHLPNLTFYRGTDYCAAPQDQLSFSLQGSAVCTSYEWVVCNDCATNPDRTRRSQDDTNGIGWALHPITGTNTTLVQRTNCQGGYLPQGIPNWVCLLFLTFSMMLIHRYLGAREVRFDEDQITSSDYTVVVQNPPPDATDPDEWRDFFSQFATKQVTAVTIALNNEKLLRKLIERRRHLNNLKLMLPKNTNMDDETSLQAAVVELVKEREEEEKSCLATVLDSIIFPILRLVGMFLPPEALLQKSSELTEEIKDLLKGKYDVTKVFVTFETEEGQRNALTALSLGRIDVYTNNTSKIANTLFKDKVLHVAETAEASAIRWLDLSASNIKVATMQAVNFLSSVLVVALCGWLVAEVRFSLGGRYSGPLVTVLNSLIPMIVKILMIFEPHHTEGDFQSSLFTKITLIRWTNTALLLKIITPWPTTLGADKSNILPSVNSLMWSEFTITPLLKILDLSGNFQKHFLAPRARTQEQMNTNFQGTPYNLGERYTDLSKVLFLCFFYSALYPASFFFGTAILILQYYSDKFCLLRVWANNADLGSEVARFSRKYFFSGAILGYCIVSAYAWAGFPYDNLCLNEEYEGSGTGARATYTNVTLINSTVFDNITVQRDEVFFSCSQNFRGFQLPFPPIATAQNATAQWMQGSQIQLANLYGWTSVAALGIYVVALFGMATKDYVASWVKSVYVSRGQEQHIDFSSDNDIVGYVPQIKVSGFLYPFIACDVDGIDESLIGWTDRGRSYDHHNLIFDVPWTGMPRQKNFDSSPVAMKKNFDGSKSNESQRRPVFSTFTHYPPEWVKKLPAAITKSKQL